MKKKLENKIAKLAFYLSERYWRNNANIRNKQMRIERIDGY